MGGAITSKAKPFGISKQEVWKAYLKVKANKGACGVDEESISDFEKDLKNNLYKLWNRMASGSYFPPPTRTVEIPKDNGGTRVLGIPTVSDRIAQMVVKTKLEPRLEPYFHSSSYGYRPGKSALEAVGKAREKCWRYDWVLDMDIEGCFDNIDHSLLMKALAKHTDCKWILLYVKRWLKAPAKLQDETLLDRNKGTPQGGVISPLLANLFLHYAFDVWMKKNHPSIPFERYADDTIVHLKSERQAKWIKEAIRERLAQCRLKLHPDKTRIVYCKDEDRKDSYPDEKFDFLGYTFKARKSKNQWGKYFINFSPAVSDKVDKHMHQTIRSWRLHSRSDKEIEDLSRMFNPIIRGWINYYGRYYKSMLYPTFKMLNRILEKWVMRKYKKLKGHRQRARYYLGRIAYQKPELFAQWQLLGLRPANGWTKGAV